MTYTYIAKDGETITGTATDIVDTIIDWHGDRATQDNPVPWEFPFIGMNQWVARAEDRPLHHVQRDLIRKILD